MYSGTSFEVSVKEKPMTRRVILSVVRSIYEPLGFIAPYTLIGKKILQDVLKQGLGWDEPIGENEKKRWQKMDSRCPRIIQGSGTTMLQAREVRGSYRLPVSHLL